MRQAREAMLLAVASQFREPAASLGVITFEPVTWQDDCLGIRRRGPCTREPTPGFRLRFRRRGETYEYHAPLPNPADVALAAGPDPHIGAPALEWSWSAAPGGCQTLLISADARPAVGWCDGPVAELRWLEGGFAGEEWAYLSTRFAAVELKSGDPMLIFAGTGNEAPSPSWQRALASWAALRWSELRTGRSGAAHGGALAYRRPLRGRADYCDILEVTEYGVAYLGRSLCQGGESEVGRTAWLNDDLWQQFSEWLGRWGATSDEALGMSFFGQGDVAPSAADLGLLAEWADRAMADVASAPFEAWPIR